MRMSDQLNDFTTALSKFQGAITPPPKSRTVQVKQRDGGSYSFAYAELDTILEHIKKPFTENGFSWFSGVTYPPNGAPVLTTRVNHVSGQWLETDYRLPNTNDPKAFAGEITYGRRYCFSMLMGLSSQQDADELPPPARGQQNPPQNRPQGQGGQRPPQGQQRGAPQGSAGYPTGQPTTGAAGATPSAAVAPNPSPQPGEQKGAPPQAAGGTAPLISPSSAQPASQPSTQPATPSNAPAPTQPIVQADWDKLCGLVADQSRFNPWTMEQLGEYMKAKYQRARLGQYSRAEYDELMEAVGALSFTQAMELTMPATNEPGSEG